MPALESPSNYLLIRLFSLVFLTFHCYLIGHFVFLITFQDKVYTFAYSLSVLFLLIPQLLGQHMSIISILQTARCRNHGVCIGR